MTKTADHPSPLGTLPLWEPEGRGVLVPFDVHVFLDNSRAEKSRPLTPAQLGQSGQEDARRHLPPVALDAIRDAIIACMAAGDFTTDLVRDRLSFAMRELVATVPNGIQGVLTGEFAKRGLIHRTGATVRSQRASARGRRLAVWAAT